MRIAILTRDDYRSPYVLAHSLQAHLRKIGVHSDVFPHLAAVQRLQPYARQKHTTKFHFWLRRKVKTSRQDRALWKRLSQYDAVVVSECIPNAFWKNLYNIEQLRAIIRKPILLYEVYYLGNAPSQVKRLRAANDPLLERYDWHLAVAPITEIRTGAMDGWSCIGLDMSWMGIEPVRRTDFAALLDFVQPGYEKAREVQLSVLAEMGIRTIVLEGAYSPERIRDIYRQAAVFFMQFPEAFGLPLAESLAAGAAVFTPDETWPMSWRIQRGAFPNFRECLGDVFTVYRTRDELKARLSSFQESYDLIQTPMQIAQSFRAQYPDFCEGNTKELAALIDKLTPAESPRTAL